MTRWYHPTLSAGNPRQGEWWVLVPVIRKEYAMRRFVRGAAALILGTPLSAVAAAQTPGAPPAAPGPVSIVPAVTPMTKPDVRPAGNAATVNNQPIPEVAVYRAL